MRVRGSHGVGRIRDRARSLRSTPTDAEQRLWSRLRNRQIEGLKFVRQYAIGPYFADFVCREAMLVVEVDGGQHAESASDGRRTRYLTDAGYAVLRFWNNEVLENTDGVLQTLVLTLRSGPSPDLRFAPATLSPEGRGDAAAPSGPSSSFSEEREGDEAGDVPQPTSPLRGEVAAQARVRGSDDPAGTRPVATYRARSLRQNETEAEHKLWSMLRGRRLAGHKFVRQLPIGPYFADFACREAALVVEVDGSQHAESSHDRVRDQFLVDQGYSVLRFWNNEVLAEPDSVATSILAALSLHPSPGERFAPATLSPEGRGEKGVSAATARQRSRHLTDDLPRLLKD